jgi:GGDEF domain-containing protein
MLLSIQKIFFNLKLSLFILGVGVLLLGLELVNITHYSQRLGALKTQHTLIDTITSQDFTDPQMAIITLNGNLAQLSLAVQLSDNDTLLDSFIPTTHEQQILSDALKSSSSAFKDAALFWSESTSHGQKTMYDQMIGKRNTYLANISAMIDYEIQMIDTSIELAKKTVIVLIVLGMLIFLLYSYRLNQIYRDINRACSVDTDGTKPEVKTQEMDFIVKRLARKSPIVNTAQSLLNPQSGLNNEKGMLTLFNAKKGTKSSNSLFVALFEIDQHINAYNTLSKEDMGAMYKKIGDIITMYEQPLDVIAHLDSNQFVFVMSRNSKDIALSDAEKIVHSVHDSAFNTAKGPIKVTLSGGFLLKTPAASLESAIADARKIADKAKENGGNRVAQLREKADQYR